MVEYSKTVKIHLVAVLIYSVKLSAAKKPKHAEERNKGTRNVIERGSKSLGLLKALYTLPPGRPVHSTAISTSLGIIQPRCNYCAKTIRSDIHLCMKPSTHSYI